MAQKKLKSTAEFVWGSLSLPLTEQAPLQAISDLLCENGYEALQETIMNYLSIYDRSGEGLISYKDFQAITSQEFDPFANEETITAMFEGIDKDGKGKITVDDLVQAAKEATEPVTADEAANMIKAFDGDKDGAIDLKEFKLIVKTKR
jgi:Ca2+-binding EF-hand superfamily protein